MRIGGGIGALMVGSPYQQPTAQADQQAKWVGVVDKQRLCGFLGRFHQKRLLFRAAKGEDRLRTLAKVGSIPSTMVHLQM